eukprot:gnl/TRDRNA2_/TRDRNA2_175814_c1_seq1.p1 gnl/TRDRNA2_/TRDRNA2_175814_c1~~gnl/TRDRNA2_/TRDRNA2_175814_c1_seq1.p1  ORF type:complete len:419 (-),score=47.45 gnl/TRDRNA2_/TRDRNA2_175814_c1_seq1:126-1298(-)
MRSVARAGGSSWHRPSRAAVRARPIPLGGRPVAPPVLGSKAVHRPPVPRKMFVKNPLPAFEDDSLPGPEPRVTAFLLPRPVDLRALRHRLTELECPTSMWQGQVLLSGSSASLGQQLCSAIFLPDGCAVLWHMSRGTERHVLHIAAGHPAPRFRLPRLGDCRKPGLDSRGEEEWSEQAVSAVSAAGDAEPLAREELDVVESPEGAGTSFNPHDGLLQLAHRSAEDRASHQLGLSLGLAVAVRLDALERRIEEHLETYRRSMHAESHRTFFLSDVSQRIFVAERRLHELRYELTDLLEAPDLLWDHAEVEHLYDQVVVHFDIRRRISLLDSRLSHSLDYLGTLSEHVRHMYSVRLERIIIVLIFLELCVGLNNTGGLEQVRGASSPLFGGD